MARRSIEWEEGLSKDLRNEEFAQEFILAALSEGISIQVVLAKVVRAYGVKEFAAKVKLPSSNLLRVINPRHNPTLGMINRLLKPFCLELSVVPARKRKAA